MRHALLKYNLKFFGGALFLCPQMEDLVLYLSIISDSDIIIRLLWIFYHSNIFEMR